MCPCKLLDAAKKDIADMLRIGSECTYCKYFKRMKCTIGEENCKPKWRYDDDE